jgi:hypothetical protein
MSIVLYHARVDDSTLDALQANPDLFWGLPDEAGPTDNQQLYTDKDWGAISWLLSAKAREEQKHQVVEFALSMNRKSSANLESRDAWKAAKREEAARRGFELVDAESMPDDPVLIAIQGRGTKHGRAPHMGLHAQTLVPDHVAALSAALDRVTEADLREHFDPRVMESLDVAGILWTEEEPDVFDKILVPGFERIRVFFRFAAQAGQHVVVVFR